MDTKFPTGDETTYSMHEGIGLLRGREKKRAWFKGKYGDIRESRSVKARAVCKFFASTGKCKNGDSCPYDHEHISLNTGTIIPEPCKFLYTNTRGCRKGSACHFSHELEKFPCPLAFGPKSPLCGDDCRFSHTEVSSESHAIEFIRLYQVYLRNLGGHMQSRWKFYLDEKSDEAVLESRTRKIASNPFNHTVGSLGPLNHSQ